MIDGNLAYAGQPCLKAPVNLFSGPWRQRVNSAEPDKPVRVFKDRLNHIIIMSFIMIGQGPWKPEYH